MHQPPIPHIDAEDPEIARLIHDEARRQADKFRLIPSENYVSLAVLEASGTVLTNKYSEGYPRRRYYEGQQLIDPLELIAIERAQALFGADHANVQPYSGSPANLVLYDPAARSVVDPDEHASRSRNTPFAGMELPGQVIATFLRGEPTVLDGKLAR